MMSMFSSFDAFCKEFYEQKVKFSGVSSTPNERSKATAVESMKKKGMEKKSSPSSENVKESLKQQRKPRFAPELDGVHCFETILPY